MKGSHSAVSSPRRWSSSSGSSSGAAGLLYPLLGACLWAAVVGYKPVIIVHGLFDSSGDFINLQRFINESHPGTNVTVIDLFDRSASLEPMWTQVEGFKAAIYPIMQNAADGVHFICYSQGGLVCRGILSTLSDHNVQSFISLSSPQAGQYGDTDYLKYLFPQFVKSNLYHICYTAIGQRISICNYWNDPHHRDLYVNSSDYLALLNSERANPNSTEWKKNFLKIKTLVLIGGPDDGVITPWQSREVWYRTADTMTEWETAPAVAETPEIKLFGKWSTDDVQINDISLQDYIAVKEKYAKYLPHSGGRYAAKRFRKAQCPIVERLTNSMMMHGRNNGKKLMTVRIVKHAFEIIHLLTGENPLQVLVNAIINSGPREDSTRIGRAGTVRRQAVDVSPLRRVNQAIWLLCTGAREAAFRNIKTIAECLADELINAAKGSSNSYAIKKKDELERVAKSNR
ncbi:40S ribosomal protein S5 40S ribosomal protein S5, N-terminally processed [Collichthys lucidus]|uniref:Small ribosomal subunit protein uS7 n=1 Tax=Collichthys lucidus TaxID=240159 RepID=A0A4U5VKL7_COLLU|nr:40S ribosomal protein S5 40S ribosomal protein S5, N-terminally processed [Collichthys lucidus]